MDPLAVIAWPVYPTLKLGPLSVSPHGLGIALGYALGGQLFARHAERKGISSDHVWNMLMRAVFGVIVGSRVLYVVGHIPDYWPNVIDILKIWEGGLVFYGGVFGGILAALPYARKNGLRFWDCLDAAAPGLVLGMVVGRIGDLIVGDHLGGPTTLPFAFRATSGDPVSVPLHPSCLEALAGASGQAGLGCHQTALYDLWSVLVLLPIVLWLARRALPRGSVIMFTAGAYAFGRFFVDFARSGTATYAGLRGTQWISVSLMLAGVWYLLRRHQMDLADRPPDAEPAGDASEGPQPVLPVVPGSPLPPGGLEPPEPPLG